MLSPLLHPFAQNWPNALADIVEAAIDEGEVGASDLRTIVIAPTRDWLTLGVWLSTEWDDYPYARRADQAAGLIPLDAWLDEVDAFAGREGGRMPPTHPELKLNLPLHFADPAKNADWREMMIAFQQSLMATARQAACGRLAQKRFEQPVGIFVALGREEAMLQAFCHPHGAPLWPLSERRKEFGCSSNYPHAAFVDEGLIVYYPKGEGTWKDEEGTPAIRTYRFADMVRATLDDDELHVRFKGEVFDVIFENGHTHEEHGGPDRSEVEAALLAHFKSRPELMPPDDVTYALPQDAAALAAWLHGFAEEHEKSNAVEELVKRHGVDAVLPLARAAGIDGAVWQRMHRDFAEALVAEGHAIEALEYLDALPPGEGAHCQCGRLPWLRAEALWQLGRHEETAGLDPERSDTIPFRALSLAALGRRDEAMAFLSSEKALTDEDCLVARAILLARDGHTTEAANALRAAFSEGTPRKSLLAQLENEPVLQPIVAERMALKAARAASAAQAATVPALPLAQPPYWDRDRAALGALGAPLVAKPKKTKNGKTVELPRLRCALRVGGRVWAGDDSGAVVELAVDGSRRELCRPCGSRRIEQLLALPSGVLVSDEHRLALLSHDGTVIVQALSLSYGSGEVAAFGDLVAKVNDAGIDLYRADRGLEHVGTLAAPDTHSFRGVAFPSPGTLLALLNEEIYVADVSDPARPRWSGKVSIPDCSEVSAFGDLALAYGDEHIWLLSFKDPQRPTTLGRFRGRLKLLVEREGDRLTLAEDGWLVRVDLGAKKVAETSLLLGSDGCHLDTPLLLWADGGEYCAVSGDGVLRLAPLAWGRSPEQIAAEMAAYTVKAEEWMKRTLQGWLEAPAQSEPIGLVRAGWYGNDLQLFTVGPRTLPGIEADEPLNAEQFCLEREEEDNTPPDEVSPAAESSEQRSQRRNLEELEQDASYRERRRALRTITSRLGDLAAASPATARQVVLIAAGERGPAEVVGVVAGRGTAGPRRAEPMRRQSRTTKERLTSDNWYQEADTLTARARRDPEFRREVLELLASEGVRAAARIALSLRDVDEAAVLKAWLAASERIPGLAVRGLVDLADLPEARRRLEELCDSGDLDTALQSRRAVGRLEEPAGLDQLRRVLALVGTGEGSIPKKSLAALSDGALGTLREALAAAHAALFANRDRDARDLLLPLVRSGCSELPAGIVEEAKEDRQSEDDEMGGLFGDEKPEEAATALRHYVARTIAKTLSAAPSAGPIWPAAVPAEPYRKSWHRFFEIAWPLWEKSGLLDTLHERLPARLSAEDGEADRQFALHLVLEDVMRGDPRADGIAAALKASPLPKKDLEKVTKLARLSRLSFGWTLLKARRLGEARQVADAALKDDAKDGQALFFDARLAWLEKDDPQEALHRIPAALEKAKDNAGRGRLYNLYGAALDAQAKYGESIVWFEKAMQADPSETAMHLSNIAEAHWKLGQKNDAATFARKAAARGSSTEIVKTILAEMGAAS